MKIVIMTNNDLVYEKYKDEYDVELYDNSSILELLEKVRPLIHKGHELLTHPLSTSVKPNETLFKSVVITKTCGKLDQNSLMILENSIQTCVKFSKIKYHLEYTDQIIKDFKLLDFTSLTSALDNISVTVGNF